jgi:hypothetical protein
MWPRDKEEPAHDVLGAAQELLRILCQWLSAEE